MNSDMFPRSRIKRRVETQADENQMVDRLQLNIAAPLHENYPRELNHVLTVIFTYTEQDSLGQYNVAEEILRHTMVSYVCQPQHRQNPVGIALIRTPTPFPWPLSPLTHIKQRALRHRPSPQTHHTTLIQRASRDPAHLTHELP
ncbi:hypothetical protein BJ165DRAFT_666534 [Panaeolus papilionaceus]|nr:hypothetical protein BJ165DRAFT_666534 [Panaeolus papilionaceus]